MFWKYNKEKRKQDSINGIVNSLVMSDFTPTEISEILLKSKSRILVFFDNNIETLNNELEDCLTAKNELT